MKVKVHMDELYPFFVLLKPSDKDSGDIHELDRDLVRAYNAASKRLRELTERIKSEIEW